MSVLILGAQGFIGTGLRHKLIASQSLISVDVQTTAPLALPDATADRETRLQVDLGDPAQIDGMFLELGTNTRDINAVLHLAAYYDFANRDDPRYHRLESALSHLLQALDKAVPATAPFIYASSMATLPSTPPGQPMGPETPPRAEWAYPRHKATCERILNAATTPRSIVQLVLAGVYSELGELVPLYQQLKRVADKSIEAMLYPGPTDRGLTYVHLDDTVEAFTRAMETFRDTQAERVRLMVAEDQPVTYRAIHDRASKALLGWKLPLVRVPRLVAWIGSIVLLGLATLVGKRRFVRPWMVRYAGEHYEIDASLTHERLGWHPAHRFSNVLDRILETARREPHRFRKVNERRPW